MADKPKPEPRDRDEPVTIPLDPEVALRALLRVQPEDEKHHAGTQTPDAPEK